MTIKTSPNLGGRPKLPPDKKKSEYIKIMLTSDEKESIRETAKRMGFEDMSEFIRFWITDLINTKGSGVDAVSAIGQVSTSGAQRVQDIDFVPVVKVVDAETGDLLFVGEPAEMDQNG